MGNVNKLIEDNLNLVHSIVHKRMKHLGHKYEYDDLFQVACIGLMRASERFKPELNLKFSTFAYPCIDGEILRHARDDSWYGRTREERKENNYPLSLNNNVKVDGTKFQDLVTYENTNEYDNLELHLLVDELPYPYNIVINEYFFNGATQAEIGEIVGLAQNTISKYVSDGLQLLKKELTR